MALPKRRGFIPRAAVLLMAASPVLAQSPTEPPATQHPILTTTGKGVQIYTCQDVSGAPKWVFQAPEAKLFDKTGQEVGTHGAGPVWKHKDGSSIKGQLVTKSDAPAPGDIPWLLLKTESHEGTGVLSTVDYIQRAETHGGVAPTTGCDAGHANATARIPYTATYTFYARKP